MSSVDPAFHGEDSRWSRDVILDTGGHLDTPDYRILGLTSRVPTIPWFGGHRHVGPSPPRSDTIAASPVAIPPEDLLVAVAGSAPRHFVRRAPTFRLAQRRLVPVPARRGRIPATKGDRPASNSHRAGLPLPALGHPERYALACNRFSRACPAAFQETARSRLAYSFWSSPSPSRTPDSSRLCRTAPSSHRRALTAGR